MPVIVMPLLPWKESRFACVLLGPYYLPESEVLHRIVGNGRDILGRAVILIVVHPMGTQEMSISQFHLNSMAVHFLVEFTECFINDILSIVDFNIV